MGARYSSGHTTLRHVQQIMRVLADGSEVVVATVPKVGQAHELARRWQAETGERHFVREVVMRETL